MTQDRKEEEYVLLKAHYPTDDRYEDATFPEKEYKIPVDRPVRIFCDGVFDLFHYGHSRLLEQVKGLFPNVHVLVGICNDEITTKFKGNLVMNERERHEGANQCRYTDEVVDNVPWVLDMDFLERNRIDYVAHDDAPYAHIGTNDLYAFIKNLGMFIPTKRAKDISTTGLITRIIKNYDQYLNRQIRRGISHKELNISLLQRERIRLRQYWNSDISSMREELKFAFRYWDSLSRKMIEKFKNRFLRVKR